MKATNGMTGSGDEINFINISCISMVSCTPCVHMRPRTPHAVDYIVFNNVLLQWLSSLVTLITAVSKVAKRSQWFLWMNKISWKIVVIEMISRCDYVLWTLERIVDEYYCIHRICIYFTKIQFDWLNLIRMARDTCQQARVRLVFDLSTAYTTFGDRSLNSYS